MPDDEQPAHAGRADARDVAIWAKSVPRLDLSDVPAGGINVSGKRLNFPIQGFGKMWQKTYQVRIPPEQFPAADLAATWEQKFPDFWPDGNQFCAPLTGIAPGEVALIARTLPGPLTLSTGSTLYLLTSPWRALAGLLRRPRAGR